MTCFSGHPRTKPDVGYRLSRSGLAVAYGQKVQFQGSIVSNVNYIVIQSLLLIQWEIPLKYVIQWDSR